ncbi:MAG: type III-B CRISPR module RAMP protein Cmr6 [Oligosphaeraceae bacterium]|nr:type III-B CRISPR module RAMP protein Cmr6 [Oligosphaeraceae bacterium]
MLTVTTQMAEILKKDFSLCESPSLRLEKYLDLQEHGKASQVEAVISCANKHTAPPPFRQHPGQIQLAATLGGNLVVNHSSGVLENTGLCLHRHFGYPIIPGSAVKGCAAHAAYREWEESPSAELAADIVAVFGFPLGDEKISAQITQVLPEPPREQSGRVSFLTAEPLLCPENGPLLVSDISTCHHPRYYQGKSAQAFDNEEPIPLPFPTVKAGLPFIFTIVPLTRANRKVCAAAQRWLLQAMTLWGMGAKTAAGYGWFIFSEQESQRILQKRQQLHSERQNALLEAKQRQAEALQRQKQEAERIAAERLRQEQTAALQAVRQNMTEEQRQDADLRDKCPDELRFRSRLQEMARGNCTEGEERAIIRALAGEFRSLWQDELKPLLNCKYRPRKGQPNWQAIASKIAERDRQFHGKENRQL